MDREEAVNAYLGIASAPSPTSPKAKSRDAAIEEFFAQPDLPPAPPSGFRAAMQNLKNLPKLVTEGLPAASRAFVQSQSEPTYGQQLAQKYPKSLYTPIPGALDLAARALRLPTSIGRGMAELGPEQARPLTEQLVQGLLNLSPAFRRAHEPAPLRVDPEAPVSAPGQRALPPVTRGERLPVDAEGQVIRRGYEVPRALPGGTAGELPPHINWETPAPPPKALLPGVPRRKGAIVAGEGEGAVRPPQEPTAAPERIPSGRPVIPESQVEKTFGIEMEPGAKFEKTAIGEQGLIGGTPKRELAARATKATKPQTALESSPLFGQAKAAREQAAEAGQAEIVDPQRAAVQEWLSDQLGSQGQMALAQAKSAAKIPPATKKQLESLGLTPQEAWDVSHAEVPKSSTIDKLYDLASISGRELPEGGPTGPAPALHPRPTPWREPALAPGPAAKPFLRAEGFEHGQPNLSDPDDVYQAVAGMGKVKVLEQDAGELADMPATLKSKNGMTLDQMAETLADQYPGLGDRAAIKEQLADTLRRYPALKQEKARTKLDPQMGAMFTDLRLTKPPHDIPVTEAEWTMMDLGKRRAALEFFRDTLTDESGRLNLKDMAKALHRFRGKFPMEEAVRTSRPDSPVISEVERWNTGLADGLQMVAEQPWWKQLRKMNPEQLKDLEQQMVTDWQAGGSTPAAKAAAIRQAPAEVQAAMRHRDQALAREQASRTYFGLDPIPETPGPYMPRKVDPESRQAVSLGAGGMGQGRALQSTVKGHQQERAFETYRQGEQSGLGLEYEDPRNSFLIREWEGLKLRATHRLFQNLEAKGALYRDQAQAMAASPTRKPWKIENAPGGGEWWTPTEAEAKFLQQNLAESQKGPTTSLVGYGNALLRNPNLVNPLPHVVKNMAIKALLARGPVAPYTLARDAVEWARGTNPQLMREFNEAMPFSAGGRTAGDVLGRELRGGTISDGIHTALRTIGQVNRPSQKVIFEWADPAMRYSLYKYYREHGKGVYEAGNHAWTDLIRYGTRSSAIDFWKSIPLNFFVPWRFGTISALWKQTVNHPVRTAALLGAIEYLREARYRATGKFTHLPYDYAAKPIATMIDTHDFKDAAAVLGTTTIFGPGGDFSAKQIGDVMLALQGKPHQLEVDRLKNAFWGISQIYNLPDEWRKGDYAGILATAMTGEHNALTYQPRRLGRYLPESLPLMDKSPLVQQAEDMQQRRKESTERSDARRETRPRKSIEDRLRDAGYLR